MRAAPFSQGSPEYATMSGGASPPIQPPHARLSAFGARGHIQGSYRANHSLRGSERASSREQPSEQRMIEAGERLRRGSPKDSLDLARGDHSHVLRIPMALPPPALFTCTVGRQRSSARFLLMGSNEVATLLATLGDAVQQGLGARGGLGRGGAGGGGRGVTAEARRGVGKDARLGSPGAAGQGPFTKAAMHLLGASLSGSSTSLVGGDSGILGGG